MRSLLDGEIFVNQADNVIGMLSANGVMQTFYQLNAAGIAVFFAALPTFEPISSPGSAVEQQRHSLLRRIRTFRMIHPHSTWRRWRAALALASAQISSGYGLTLPKVGTATTGPTAANSSCEHGSFVSTAIANLQAYIVGLLGGKLSPRSRMRRR